MSTETNILLPTAGVDIFVRDRATLEAARSLVDDWRFARVTISVEEGDVEAAILSYQEARSPNLVIIETDTTDESFTDRLGVLSGYCAEGTNAMVIGPVNDVTLYRNLTSMGVSDYLVKPVPVKTLSEIIAKALIDKLGISGSRLIGVIGAKGGVGTSALAQGLAYGLTEKLGHKTFFMDAAGGWSTMGAGLGFEPTTTLAEAVRAAENADKDTLERMFYKVNDKLTVLASGADAMLDVSVLPAEYEALIDLLMVNYPVVIVDLSAAVPSLKKAVLSIAHELIVVTTPSLQSLRAARTLMQEIKLIHGGDVTNVDLIVNMAGMAPTKEVPKKDIRSALEYEPALTIPFDPKLFIGAENEGKKLTDDKDGIDIISRLLPLASKVLGEPSRQQDNVVGDNFLTQIMQKIVGKR